MFEEVFRGRLSNFSIQGPVFQYNGLNYEVKKYNQGTLQKTVDFIISEMKDDESFAIYEIRSDLIRGAIIPAKQIHLQHHTPGTFEIGIPMDVMTEMEWMNDSFDIEWVCNTKADTVTVSRLG